MEEPTKQISRRDAMKLLGAAAGATVLANLPTKWQTPQLAAGVLPAHAQTSAGPRIIVRCTNGVNNVNFPGDAAPVGIAGGSSLTEVFIAAADSGISMHYKFELDNLTLSPLEGDVPTTGGMASLVYSPSVINAALESTTKVTWTFTSLADGSGTCSASHTYPAVD